MAFRQKARGGKDGGRGGCPDYMVIYGDMMSLLLCFFVIIVSLSQFKEEQRFHAVLDSIKKAFGYSMSRSPIPDGSVRMNTNMTLVESINKQIKRSRNDRASSQTHRTTDTPVGRDTTVRNIREGLMLTVGGLALFEEGRADLLPAAREDLARIAELIVGYRNKILIRGHTSRAPLPEDSPFKNHVELSYARALAVMEFLAEGTSSKIKRDRMNIEACGYNEPLKVQVFSEERLAGSRRVEIIVKDTMVEDYEGPPDTEQ